VKLLSATRRWCCACAAATAAGCARPREILFEFLAQDGVEHFETTSGEFLDAFPELRAGARLVEHAGRERFASRTAAVEAVEGALLSQTEIDVRNVELPRANALQRALFQYRTLL
jgi:hypothetical protein